MKPDDGDALRNLATGLATAIRGEVESLAVGIAAFGTPRVENER